MKVIFSRKGFDSGYGGQPSPILPDGTMLSLPLPSLGDKVQYNSIVYREGWLHADREVAFCEGNAKYIYFVAETKGNEWQHSQLRGAEDCKLECAARHFEDFSQSGNVIYGVARDYKTLYDKVMK